MNERAKIKGTAPCSIEASITIETHFHVIQELGRKYWRTLKSNFPPPTSKVTYLFALQPQFSLKVNPNILIYFIGLVEAIFAGWSPISVAAHTVQRRATSTFYLIIQ